jgi:hypothetical protein
MCYFPDFCWTRGVNFLKKGAHKPARYVKEVILQKLVVFCGIVIL